MSRETVIFGCGGHARSVADVLLSAEPAAGIVFVDENARPDEEIFGFSVIKSVELSPGKEYFVAIGDNYRRKEIRVALGDLTLRSVISPSATVRRDVTIEQGSFVANEAYVGPLSSLGTASIINTRAQIDHEVVIGSDSQLGPHVVVGGRVKIGDRVFVGLGARVIDNVSICSDVVVGASSTVIDSIDEPGTYVGTPARQIK